MLIALGIAVYVIVMFGIAFRVSDSSGDLEDYLLAGRNLSLGVCTISIIATWFGSGPMMGTAAAAYTESKLDLLFDPIACSGCLIIIGVFFIKALRRSKKLTWIQIVEEKLGKTAGLIALVVDMAGAIMWLGGVLFAFGVVFETLTGASPELSLVIGTLIVVVYTLIGGLRAVALTDVLQMGFIVVGLVTLLYMVVADTGDNRLVLASLDRVMSFTPLSASVTDWADYIHIWVAAGLGGALTTSVLQRGMAVRTEADSQWAFVIAGIAYFFLALIPVGLGAAATILLPDVEDPNSIIPLLALEYLHPLAAVLFVGAILSAIMSTADSILLSSGTVVSTNVLPLLLRDPTDKIKLLVARLSIPVVAGIAILVALNGETVLELIFDSLAFATAGIIGPFILCLWWQKTNRMGGLLGMVGGLGSYFWLFTIGASWPDLAGFCVSLTLTVFGSLLTQKFDTPQELTDIEGKKLNLEGTVGFRSLTRYRD